MLARKESCTVSCRVYGSIALTSPSLAQRNVAAAAGCATIAPASSAAHRVRREACMWFRSPGICPSGWHVSDGILFSIVADQGGTAMRLDAATDILGVVDVQA